MSKPTPEAKLLGGRYSILKPLGMGGYGKTYLAQDWHLPGHPLCVVKQLQPQVQNEENLKIARRLFDTEAEVLYKLGHHPQIPRLFAHFEDQQEFYLVQEYIKGIDLSQELAAQERWNEFEVVQFLQEILQILTFVHSQNVIHRDIKPANIIRQQNSEKLVLIDFGAVKQVSTQVYDAQGQITHTVAVGTKGYIPEEQKQGNPQFASDIYAVGMICVQALSGLNPSRNLFPQDPETGEIVWRSRLRINPDLAKIIDRTISYRYQDRYLSSEAVLQDLAKIQSQFIANTPITKTATQTKPLIITPGIMSLPNTNTGLNTKWWYWGGGISIAIAMLLFLGKIFSSPSTEITTNSNVSVDASNASSSTELSSAQTQEIESLLTKVNQAQANQNYQQALIFYEKALKINLDDPNVSVQRCYILNQMRRFDYAAKSCTHAVEISPEDEKAWWNLGLAFDKLGEYEQALEAYRQALAINPDFAEALSNQGVIFYRLQRYEEALKVYDQTLKLQPDVFQTWNNRGVTLNRLGRYQEALISFDKAIEIRKDYPEAWNNRGSALLNLRRYQEALDSYNQAIELKPDYQAAIDNRKQLKTRQNSDL